MEKMKTEANRLASVQHLREQGEPFTPSAQPYRSFGILSPYAKPELIPQESGAFERSMVEKHET